METYLLDNYENQEINLESITPLYEDKIHTIYWLGIDDETAFRCNVYLIKSGEEGIIVDPGSRSFFQTVQNRVKQIMPLENITSLIVCHQDPDVAASIIDWLEFNPKITIFSSARTNVLLPHYGINDYTFFNISEQKQFSFKTGKTLQFIEAPFLHFPGAFTTYDVSSKFLLSGDIWAALDTNWKLTVNDFDEHKMNMDLFHIDYMASNIAARGFVENLSGIEINAILPQHGSIIPQKFVNDAISYLQNLKCGLDITYAHLNH